MSGLSNFFDGLWNTLKTAEEQALLPAAATMATNLSLNPSVANFVAQGNLFLASALAAQGKIETAVLQSIATTLAAAAVQAIPPVSASPAATTATTAK